MNAIGQKSTVFGTRTFILSIKHINKLAKWWSAYAI